MPLPLKLGTTAELGPDGKRIALQDDMNGNITIENIQIEGIDCCLGSSYFIS